MDRKDEQVRRYLKGAKRQKSLDERKELQRLSRERRNEQRRGRRTRRQDWSDEEDAFERESMGSARARHARREQLEVAAVRGSSFEGRVVRLHPGRAGVLTGGEVVEARVSDELRRAQASELAVGDRVVCEDVADGEPVLRTVHARASQLSRPDPARPGVERLIAANVDAAVVCVAAKEPALRIRLVDRYLVATARGGVAPIVCVTKIDLCARDERDEVERELAAYRELDVPFRLTSTATGEGVESLRALCEGRTVVVVGQSGVGKSSLLGALCPSLELETGRVREGDGKGRHTTTVSHLLEADGLSVIDTPGVRSFGLAGLGPGDLAGFFPELVARAGDCRFRDCTHDGEPDCAVRAAVERGELDARRFATYHRIRASLG